MFTTILGLFGGTPTLIMALLVIKLYFRTGCCLFNRRRRHAPEIWFAHGIVVGFTAIALHAIMEGGLIKVIYSTPLEGSSGVAYSVLMTTLILWAAFCHLFAAWLNLSREERSGWHWLTVAFYPNGNSFTRLLFKVLEKTCRHK